jgi:hypothetical protein
MGDLEHHYLYNKAEYFKPYDFQKEFFFAEGKDTPGELATQRALISANQIGKTLSEAMECSYHLTGRYPLWWEGRRFKHAVSVLVASNTNEQNRRGITVRLNYLAIRTMTGHWGQGPYRKTVF